MTFEDSLNYIIEKGISAYEIYKKTDLTEAGVRKVLSKKVLNPQRKTREIIIEFANKIKQNDTKTVTLSVEELKKMEELSKGIIENHHKLLNIEVYGLWFENEVLKKAIQILKE